jgi:hypothetical protein
MIAAYEVAVGIYKIITIEEIAAIIDGCYYFFSSLDGYCLWALLMIIVNEGNFEL